MSEDVASAVRKLEERIEALKESTTEKFLEQDRLNNSGVIIISGSGCPRRKRNEKLFFLKKKTFIWSTLPFREVPSVSLYVPALLQSDCMQI